MSDSRRSELTEDLLSSELVNQLKQRYGPPFDVPESVDDRILANARTRLTSERPVVRTGNPKRNVTWKVAATATTAAAMLLIGVMRLNQPLVPRDEVALNDAASAGSNAAFPSTDDVDGDGSVDILDAFALARLVKDGGDLPSGQDRDNDGQVSFNDADLLARSVVML
jgi:hypothetical protein